MRLALVGVRLGRRQVVRLAAVVLGFILLVGPWPMLDISYTATDSFRDTLHRLDDLPVQADAGPLLVGVAEIALMPGVPVPVAGFIDQIWQPYVAINSPCFGRALTIVSGRSTVTILAADLLLIDAALAQRILTRTGLRRDQIFFTATHTHSGPGGWGNHPLERLVAGTYDPEVVAELADRLARVVQTSRARLQPAEVAFVQTQVHGLQRNRITSTLPTNDCLSAWIFRRSNSSAAPPVLATLASFGAHATIGHPRPARLGGDYPEAFAATLRAGGKAGMVLFAAGTVGDASPIRPPASNQQQSVQIYGQDLATRLTPLLDTAEFHREIVVANLGLAVDLPPVQVPFLSSWTRFSPLAFWWVAPRKTFLHTLRLGPAILAGFPGDLAGHLGAELAESLPVVATSFNGDYKGYLVTPATFRTYACYETRSMSFFGPDLGQVLIDLSRKSIRRILTTRVDKTR